MAKGDWSIARDNVAKSLSMTPLPQSLADDRKDAIARRILRLARCDQALGDSSACLSTLQAFSPAGFLPLPLVHPLAASVSRLQSQAVAWRTLLEQLRRSRGEQQWREVVRLAEYAAQQAELHAVQMSSTHGRDWSSVCCEALLWLGRVDEEEAVPR